jgi:dTDP-4-dehydrorhamnose 3,5-epimerase
VRFLELALPGSFLVHLEPHEDERGFFARAYCEREFAAHGLPTRFPQCNLSRNRSRGTLRGMHYQAAPHREAKLVRCVTGAIHDVIVDLRPQSPTRGRWVGVDLTARGGEALYVPPGFGHGFLTLEDETDVFYQMGEFFVAEAARGFRWNDPAFAISWPFAPAVMSERDRSYPDFDESRFDG